MNTTYVGKKLKAFRHAINRKAYFASLFQALYTHGNVTEVGAG